MGARGKHYSQKAQTVTTVQSLALAACNLDGPRFKLSFVLSFERESELEVERLK